MAKKLFLLALMMGSLLQAMDRHRIQPTIERAHALVVTSNALSVGACFVVQPAFYCMATRAGFLTSVRSKTPRESLLIRDCSGRASCRAVHQKTD